MSNQEVNNAIAFLEQMANDLLSHVEEKTAQQSLAFLARANIDVIKRHLATQEEEEKQTAAKAKKS